MADDGERGQGRMGLMTSTLLTKGTLVVDEKLQTRAAELVAAVADERAAGLVLTTNLGRSISLDADIAESVHAVLARVAQGGATSIRTMPEVLTTSAAAEVLGISRPTLMKLIHAGELPSMKVGTHHRVRHSDVVVLRRKRETVRDAAVQRLLEIDD